MEKKPYRGGRPELTDSERSDIRITVRFNDDEHSKLLALKDGTKTRNLSTFIRDICLQKPIPIKAQHETYQNDALSLLIETRADVLRIGVNVNQAAKRINSTTDYHDLQRDVNEMAARVSHLDAQILTLMAAIQPQSNSHGC